MKSDYEQGYDTCMNHETAIRNELKARIAELELELNNTKFHAKTLQELLTKSMDRIAELEAAQRQNWIPVGERLPLLRYGKAVLVFTKSGETYSGLYLGNNEWTGLERDFREGEVTHWMPLPEPPEVQE